MWMSSTTILPLQRMRVVWHRELEDTSILYLNDANAQAAGNLDASWRQDDQVLMLLSAQP